MENLDFDELLQEYQQTTDTQRKLQLIEDISKQLLQSGRYDESRQYALQGLTMITQNAENNKSYELHSVIGVGYMHQNDYELAKKYLTEAQIIAETTQNSHQIALIYNNLACLAYSVSDIETALEYYKKSEKISEINDYADNLISVYLNTLRIYIDLKKYDQAHSYFKKIVATSPSEHFLAQAQVAYGNLYFDINNLKLASYYTNLALKYYRTSEERYYTAGCLLQLADICTARKQLDKAIEYANEALGICTECHFDTYHIEAILISAIIYLKKGDYTRAKEYFDQLKGREDTINEIQELRVYYKHISEYYTLVGDTAAAETYQKKYDMLMHNA